MRVTKNMPEKSNFKCPLFQSNLIEGHGVQNVPHGVHRVHGVLHTVCWHPKTLNTKS